MRSRSSDDRARGWVVTLPVVAVPLARTDVTSRRKLVVAKAMFRGLDLYERLTSRLLVSVTAPAEISSIASPNTWTRSDRATCSTLGPSRSERSAARSRPMPGR
jgi:hypothetical protein